MQFQKMYRALKKKNYYVFSFEDIITFFPEENRSNLEKRVYTWKKQGWISTLKKGLYELTYPENLIIPDLYIANRLYEPSYVSLETALSYYSIIPEVSMSVTSVSTKPTREFRNRHGLFAYHTVKPNFFTGYRVMKQNNFEILIAEPEKAMVDFLYFNKKINFAEERLEKDILSKLSKKKMNNYAKLRNVDLREFYAYIRSLD